MNINSIIACLATISLLINSISTIPARQESRGSKTKEERFYRFNYA